MCFECANSIEIVLPAALEAQIESTNGNVEIERQMNNLLINTTNGSVFVKDALETTVATINGNVELENITGNLNVETTNGSVQAKTIQGKLEIDTINGQVTIQNAILPSNSSNTISTNNDDIRLQNINTQDGFVVRGSSNNGTLEFNLKGFSLRMSQDNFVATRVGQATSNLTLSSNNGSVQVNP